MAIAWVNGVFSGLDQLRRLRRAPSAQTRTEAQPRSDHRTMQQLRQGDAEREKRRTSEPPAAHPPCRQWRTHKPGCRCQASRYFVSGRDARSSSSSARTERGGIPSRWCAPDGSFPRDARSAAPAARTACIAKPGDAPKYGARGRAHNASDGSAPPPAQEQGTQSAPPVSAPPSPPQTDGGGSPGGMRGRGGEGGAAAGGRDRTGPGVRAGGALEERRHCTAARVGSTPL